MALTAGQWHEKHSSERWLPGHHQQNCVLPAKNQTHGTPHPTRGGGPETLLTHPLSKTHPGGVTRVLNEYIVARVKTAVPATASMRKGGRAARWFH